MKRSFKTPLLVVLTLLALAFSALGVSPAYAATTTVTNNLDSGPGSLRQAIANAASGTTVNFDNDYTITLASQLEIIDKTITITGAGHHITISGNNAVRVFHVGQSGGSGNLTIDHLNIVNGKSTIEECAGSAVACGGGLMLEYLTTATVLNSTFANNDGGMAGGAIYSYYGNPLTVTNSTFINNHAQAYAGAIETFYGSATLTNNTFIGNTSGAFGSTFLNTWGTVTLRNNIFVKGATSINACDSDFSDGGSTTDGGGNVRYGDATCPGTTITPLLGTSDYYGGDVPTLPLLPGSGAFSAATANCPATDARGVARTAPCDPGVFESQGFTLTKTGGDSQSAVINTAFANSLTLSVTANHAADPVDGGLVTFTAPSSGASASLTGSPVMISGGAASVSATANGTAGGPYAVTASTTGATSVNFALTNLGIPTVTTGAATSVTTSGATLNGTVNANGGSTTVTFEYGPTVSYGFTAIADQSPVTGSTDTPVTAVLTGLTPNTPYHFRVVAGSVAGSDQSFTTLALPTVTTKAASTLATTRATLNGLVNAHGGSVSVTFEYGLTASYGFTVIATPGTVTGSADTAVKAALIGLTPNTVYHFRAVADGIVGADRTFTTAKLLERAKNGGFELYGTTKVPTSWSPTKFGALDGKDTLIKKLGKASVKIVGAGATIKTLTQTLILGGAAGDLFTFSYWVKGTSVPKVGTCQSQVLLYNGATLKYTQPLACPTATTFAWQQMKVSFTAPTAYTRVVVKFTVKKASGTLWFDVVSLKQ